MDEQAVAIDLKARRETIDWENRKIKDVLNDLEVALRNAGIAELGDAGTFFRMTYKPGTFKVAHQDTLWPCWETLGKKGRCWAACYPVRGGNEGYYAHLDVIHSYDDKMVVHPITWVKVWSWQDAYEIAVLSARLLDATI